MDEETENFLRPHALKKRRLIDGVFYFHYADGSVEIKSWDEVVSPMLENINRRKKDGK